MEQYNRSQLSSLHDDIGRFSKGCQIEAHLPVMLAEKLHEIVDKYFQVKPKMDKMEKDAQILLKYNKKLVQVVDHFQTHERSLIQKYNALADIFIKSMNKYCQSKNWSFHHLFTPLSSIFQQFSLKDFEMQPENKEIVITPTYQNKIFNLLMQTYLNRDQNMERQVETKLLEANEGKFQKKITELSLIQTMIKEFNKRRNKVTIEDMFEVVEIKRRIQTTLKYYQINDHAQVCENNFYQEVLKLHTELENADKHHIQQQLRNQFAIRTKIRKLKLIEEQKFTQAYEKIQAENSDLKEDNEELTEKLKKTEEEQKIYSQKLAQMQFLNMKNSSKRSILNISSMHEEEQLRNKYDHIKQQIDKEKAQIQRQVEQLNEETNKFKNQRQQFNREKEHHLKNMQSIMEIKSAICLIVGEINSVEAKELEEKGDYIQLLHIIHHNINQKNLFQEIQPIEIVNKISQEQFENQSLRAKNQKLMINIMEAEKTIKKIIELVTAMKQMKPNEFKRQMSQIIQTIIKNTKDQENQILRISIIYLNESQYQNVQQDDKIMSYSRERLKNIQQEAEQSDQINQNLSEKIQCELNELKSNSNKEDDGEDFQGLYQRYKQAVKCCEQEETINRKNQVKYQQFVEQFNKKGISNPNLLMEEKLFFLTKRIHELQSIIEEQKIQFETVIVKQIHQSTLMEKNVLNYLRTQSMQK